MFSRRQFLHGTSLVSLAPLLPRIFEGTAQAADAAADARVLVVIQLDGGNDGINTVVPFGDHGYGRVRRKLRLEAADLHKLNDHVGLHPSMQAAKDLFDEGRLAIVQGVGYPNPDRSHFRSMRIWQTARFEDAEHDTDGWLGRSLGQPSQSTASGATADAIFVGQQETPIALWGRQSLATSLTQAEDLHLDSTLVAPQSLATSPAGHSELHDFVTRQVLSAYASANEFTREAARGAGSGDYPDSELGSHLKLVSALLRSGSQARVYYTVQPGYDTHSEQLFTHAQLLREFSEALSAFLNDLRSARLDDRVAVLAFSEFGRRVLENDSRGTDHGTAGPVFIAGGPVAGGLKGVTPDLTDLAQGDLKVHTDFRRVYATLLEHWLHIDSRLVLGGSFAPLKLFVV